MNHWRTSVSGWTGNLFGFVALSIAATPPETLAQIQTIFPAKYKPLVVIGIGAVSMLCKNFQAHYQQDATTKCLDNSNSLVPPTDQPKTP